MTQNTRSGGSGCLPFILGVMIGGTCLFPRGCNYHPPEIKEIDSSSLEVRETPSRVRVYTKQPDGKYILKQEVEKEK
ncbi:hypothetical protein J4408_00745 [Candidatus Pacearchaeota archaeon]|nr:hypothetical protein [Candidatus Pacearchaeota archaeon]